MTTPDGPCWLLVAPAEVGLLHRLRPAVRATGHGVLVQLEAAPAVPGGQLGVAQGADLTWFGGLTADDVATLVRLVRTDAARELTDALAHRVVGRSLSAGRASPRT